MNTERNDSNNPWSSFIWGSLLLAAGLIFWLDRQDYLDAGDWLRWWPVALIAIGVAYLPQRRWFSALFHIFLGVFFLLPKLGYSRIALWQIIALWPLLITVAGVLLIVQTLRRRRGGAQFRAIAVMAGNHVTVGARDFAGGQAIAVMGGCDIDLTSALSVQEDAVVDVLAFWGGIDIRVPRGWNVINRVAPILGGFESRTETPGPNAPRLVIRGAAIMGGVEVKHWQPAAEAAAQENA